MEEKEKMEDKFKPLYLSGKVEFEDINEYINRWGEGEDDCTLREYLGLNAEEEDVWIEEGDDALKALLDLNPS